MIVPKDAAAPAGAAAGATHVNAAVARQLAKYTLVGAGNTLIAFVVYAVLVAAVPSAAAAALAFVAGAANGYLWNGRWTFADRGARPAVFRYGIVQVGGLAAADALVGAFGDAGLPHLAAFAATACIVTCATFVASRTWVFRPSQ
jgi:putative flippase GtrA